MSEIFSRTEALLGKEAMEKLKNSRVALFGLGGVGSAASLSGSALGAAVSAATLAGVFSKLMLC
jgi:tRNA A37 threonylcarbamoyladenosine dehydratase